VRADPGNANSLSNPQVGSNACYCYSAASIGKDPSNAPRVFNQQCTNEGKSYNRTLTSVETLPIRSARGLSRYAE
jgi:hypothetical protein